MAMCCQMSDDDDDDDDVHDLSLVENRKALQQNRRQAKRQWNRRRDELFTAHATTSSKAQDSK